MLSSQEFIVHWGDDLASKTMLVRVKMDGRIMSNMAHKVARIGSLTGAIEGYEKIRAFTFARLVLTGKVIRYVG